VGRREATCSAVSGKYLARTLHGRLAQKRRRHRPAASTASDWHLRLHCSPQQNWVESTAQGNETKAGQAVFGQER
jgi:hypothetical protein